MLNLNAIDWDKGDGLVPAIVQDAFDGRVLMLGYMNRQSAQASIDSGKVTFWSRSRQTLWTKGETSGNHLQLVSLSMDCDRDCLLALATPLGPTCHTGTDSCFDTDIGAEDLLPRPALSFVAELERVIQQRDRERPSNSYTTHLFEAGIKRIAQKVGEEGVETALAAATGDQEELLNESADLLYHLLVLLRSSGTDLHTVLKTLIARHG